MDLDYFCTEQQSELLKLSDPAQIRALRERRYSRAHSKPNRIGQRLSAIARWLGHDPAAYDDSGRRTGYVSEDRPTYEVLVTRNGQLTKCRSKAIVKLTEYHAAHWTKVETIRYGTVYSSHPGDYRIIPGPWLKLLLDLEPQAIAVQQCAAVSEQRQHFAAVLGLNL